VHVMHDRDVVLTELFQDEKLAVEWAKAYGDRLRGRGWFDTPHDSAKAG